MKKGFWLSAVVLLLVMLAVAACAPQPAPTPSPPAPVATPLAPAPAPAQPLATPAPWGDWDKVVEAAKKEGKVNVYTSTIPLPSQEPLAKAFKEKYGIGVEYVRGRGVEISEKVIAEQRAKGVVADVYETGVPTHFVLRERGYLAGPIVVPEAQEADKVWVSNPWEMDKKEHYYFSYYEYTPGPVVNTNLVKPAEEPKSWFDLLDPKWKGKIIWDDPTVPGPGIKILSFLKQYVGGMDYWEKLARNDVKFMRDRLAVSDGVVRGDYPVAVGVFTAYITRGLKAGAPIKNVWLKEGNAGAGWTLSLIKNAPHPNAAKLFVNWFISKDGQLVFSRAGEVASFRTDVPQEHVHPYFRVTKETKIQSWTPEDEARQLKDQDLAAELFKLRR